MSSIVVDGVENLAAEKCVLSLGKFVSAFPFCLLFVMLGIALLELLNSPCGIYQFLLTGEKRMASGTNLNLHLFEHRAEFNFSATCAHGLYFMIIRMDIGFHDYFPPMQPEHE